MISPFFSARDGNVCCLRLMKDEDGSYMLRRCAFITVKASWFRNYGYINCGKRVQNLK